MANTIVLNEYTAAIKDSPKKYLEFGTYDSYGREHINVMPESGWEDLSVYVTFISPKKVKRTVLLTDPVIPVPKDATAGCCGFGAIVFAGYKDGECIITCDVPYHLGHHSNIEPDEYDEEDVKLLEQIMSIAEFLRNLARGGKKGQVFTKLSDKDLDIGWETPKESSGTVIDFKIGNGLLYDETTKVLSVDVANDAEKDNTRPISSAAVDTIVGNIDVLLSGL